MQGGSGSPVCWTLTSKGTPNTPRPVTSVVVLVFVKVLGMVLQNPEAPLDPVFLRCEEGSNPTVCTCAWGKVIEINGD